MSPSPTPPVALTIAGSDCSAGAGLQADLKTCTSLGVHCLTVVTAVVAETPAEVTAIEPVPLAVVQEQLTLLLDSYPVAALKTGMLFSKAHIVAVAEILAGRDLPLVVDPVMIASTGDRLLEDDAVAAYLERLLPLATVVTPNVPEAETLLGLPLESGRPVADLAAALSELLGCAVLVKGGHRTSEKFAVDVLADAGRTNEFKHEWIDCFSAHGTGCTLSAALMAHLSRGTPLVEATSLAKQFVTHALATSYAFPGKLDLAALNQLPILPDARDRDCQRAEAT